MLLWRGIARTEIKKKKQARKKTELKKRGKGNPFQHKTSILELICYQYSSRPKRWRGDKV